MGVLTVVKGSNPTDWAAAAVYQRRVNVNYGVYEYDWDCDECEQAE